MVGGGLGAAGDDVLAGLDNRLGQGRTRETR